MKKVVAVMLGLVCLFMVDKAKADCTGTIFSDVNEASVGYVFCDYIERFSVLGITTGYGDGTYRPWNNVNRAQIATFFMRAIDNVLQQKYGKVAIVAQSGGDYTSPVDAMSDLATWCGTPSETNPCLLKIMPGVYNIGTSSLQMQAHVDIEGSGELTTKITGIVSSAGLPAAAGLVNGASSAEMRFFTVEDAGSGDSAAAIYNNNVSPKITHVTANASGASTNGGIWNISSSPTMIDVTANASGGIMSAGVINDTSSPMMIDVTANASGGVNGNYGVANGNTSSPTMINVAATGSGGMDSYGVYNFDSSPTMTNVTAISKNGANNYGMYNDAFSGTYTIYIDRSTFEGSTNSIRNDSEFTLYIGASKLAGGVPNALGTYHCVGAYNGSYTALNSSCQ